MKLNLVFVAAVALLDTTVSAVAIPDNSDLTSIHLPAQQHAQRDASASWTSTFTDLWKRRGGGGSGGRGGGSSSSSGGSESGSGSSSSSGSSSGSSSSSGKTGSSSSSGSTSSSSSGRGSSTSSTGGKTTTGSGAATSYGGGRYYGGGSSVPYRAGGRSTGGISPLPLLAIGALAFWPGLWLHPVYIYPYNNQWNYHNATTDQNETKPVQCGCDETAECGCDDNNSTDYINSVLGNGSYDQLNQSLVTVAPVNGTDTILLNGTLPNGTTASGGSDDPSAAPGMRRLVEMAGWWPVAATVLMMFL